MDSNPSIGRLSELVQCHGIGPVPVAWTVVIQQWSVGWVFLAKESISLRLWK